MVGIQSDQHMGIFLTLITAGFQNNGTGRQRPNTPATSTGPHLTQGRPLWPLTSWGKPPEDIHPKKILESF